YENQDYPFEKLVEQLDLRRDLGRNPLFDTMFILQNMDRTKMEIENGRITPYHLEHKVSKFDLTLEAVTKENGLQMYLEYSSELFAPETISRMSGHLTNIMNAVTLQPESEIRQLDILTTEERKQLLHTFNATEVEYPKEKAVHQLFEEQVEKTPNHVAVICEGKEMTYLELNEKANQLARRLRAYGVQTDTIVGLMVERSFEMLIGIMGILKAGGAYLPIDPEYPEERIEYMLEDSGTKLLLSQEHLMKRLNYPGQWMDLTDRELYTGDASNVSVTTHPSNLIYVIYTSGSTGRPKGVMIEHKSVVNFITGLLDKIDFDSFKTILSQTTISFDIFALETLLPFTVGLSIVLISNEEKKNIDLLIDLIDKTSIDIFQMTPSQAYLLLENKLTSKLFKNECMLLLGGEALNHSLVDKLSTISKGSIHNLYGPTESTIWSTFKENIQSSDNITIGSPIQNTQVYILGEQGELQPIGVPGELHISGAGLARGYLNKPELTAEKFIPNPYVPGERMYRTGDLTRWLPDGTIEY
ncbi:amino acid adenylation domain-containing protein, partial [Paenibacillus illinoisensis]|uniref:non-ribosomal peptide synthetase n=1 Tax=Paenibacillus illinoisensis TaxID=59845 RepID=UPI001C8EC98D